MKIVAMKSTPISTRDSPEIGIGLTSDVIPKMRKILKILDPITFPTAKSTCFFIAAATLVASSGRLVPSATSVSPIKASESPNALARIVAFATKSVLPSPSPTSPKTIKNVDFGIDISLTSELSDESVFAIPKV